MVILLLIPQTNEMGLELAKPNERHPLHENSMVKYKKYELIEDKLMDYVDDYLHLDDWVPYELDWKYFYLGYDQGEYTQDTYALFEKYHDQSQLRCKFSVNATYIEETLDWEIEIFLNKYPQFKPLYHVNEEYEYGGWKNKYQRSNNIFSRMLRGIFSF